MRILVVGGSNSLLKGGYLERTAQILQANIDKEISITNISIGGTSTITGISRIFEIPAEYECDIVLYEYAMNDMAHFTSRHNGSFIQFLSIQLMVGVLAERFPGAVFVPLTLAMRGLFVGSAPNKIHEMQNYIWSATQLKHLNVRRTLSYLFAKDLPPWLYSDDAHYSVPYGADIVGSIVARFLIEVSSSPDRQPLSDLYARILALPQASPLRIGHLSSQALLERASGDVQLIVRSNSVMTVSALRLRPGGRVKVAEQPFNISVLSDRNHDWARLVRGEGDHTQSWILATRFVGVDNPVANPAGKDRFFYSGIPLPLLLHKDDPSARNAEPIELRVETLSGAIPPLLSFDGFRAANLGADCDRRLDIAGMTFLEAV